MFVRQGSSWSCETPWKGLGIDPAGETQGIPTILPWAPSAVSHLPLQPCWRSWKDGIHPGSKLGIPHGPTSKPHQHRTLCCRFRVERWLRNPPADSESNGAPARGNFILHFQHFAGIFFFHLAPFIPFPKSPVFRERLWSSLICNLTSPPVTFVSLAPGAIPNFKIWLWPSQEAQRQIPCWLQSVPAGKGLGDQYWPKLPGLFPLYPMG